MKITTVGIDLAKSVFSMHGIDEHGKAVLRRTVGSRIARLPPLESRLQERKVPATVVREVVDAMKVQTVAGDPG